MEFIFYKQKPSMMRALVGTPDRIRTYNLLIRSEVLYPVEPRVQILIVLLTENLQFNTTETK